MLGHNKYKKLLVSSSCSSSGHKSLVRIALNTTLETISIQEVEFSVQDTGEWSDAHSETLSERYSTDQIRPELTVV